MCPKIDKCEKIKMILDKEMLDGQYAECIKKACEKCGEIGTTVGISVDNI
jgi:hypothetical protein